MATNTPRFDLGRFDPGEDGWDHTDAVNLLDELGIDRGPIADRPTSGDYDDQMYYATDQGLFWRWDQNATDWVTDNLGTQSEPVPGTSYFESLFSNDITTGNVDATSVETEELVIGGKIYEEDDNSPFDPNSSSSVQYSLSGSYDEVIVLTQPTDSVGFDELRINSVSSGDYNHTTEADSGTTGSTEIPLGQTTEWLDTLKLRRNPRLDAIGFRLDWATFHTGLTVRGGLQTTETSIDSFTFIKGDGTFQDIAARVYGRDMQI